MARASAVPILFVQKRELVWGGLRAEKPSMHMEHFQYVEFAVRDVGRLAASHTQATARELATTVRRQREKLDAVWRRTPQATLPASDACPQQPYPFRREQVHESRIPATTFFIASLARSIGCLRQGTAITRHDAPFRPPGPAGEKLPAPPGPLAVEPSIGDAVQSHTSTVAVKAVPCHLPGTTDIAWSRVDPALDGDPARR